MDKAIILLVHWNSAKRYSIKSAFHILDYFFLISTVLQEKQPNFFITHSNIYYLQYL